MQRKLLVLFLIGLLYVEASSDTACLPPNWFKCKNDKCISHFFVCDDDNTCGDNSDEENCGKPLPTFAEECKANEYQCHDHFHCIPHEEFCDNKKDCLDGSDEFEDCYLNKTCTEFKCKNGHCVSQKWVCDGFNDCKDNSDELANCSNIPIPPENCNNTIDKYLCANKRCLSLSLVCNGKDDCGDDSDENPAECAKAKTVCDTTHSCGHTCNPTPKGYQCSCKVGYRLQSDGSCKDIDECAEMYGVCSQACRNNDGSFYCQCELGYKIQDDQRSCKADSGEALMIFASKTSIRGYYLESQIYFPIVEDLQHVVGVSLDSTYVYWSDIQLGDEAIFRSLEDGTKREVIVTAGLGCPEDIAVDWITGNIYFTDSMYKHIGACNKDGSYCTVIIKENTEKPRGIALLPSEGKMFWSDWGENPHISVANMDGQQRKFLIKDKIGWPNGLTIDYPNSRLYWVDAKLKVIESTKLDGQDRRIILHDVAKHPYSIAIFENLLYWSDWSTNSIHSCNKFTGKDFSTLFKKNETVYGIHIYHSTIKVKYVDPCATKPCSQLCLLSANRSYTCACTLDKELSDDHHSCTDLVKRKHMAIAAGNTIIDYYHELLGRPRMSAGITSDHITAMTYDSITDSVIAADEMSRSIFRYNQHTGSINHIIPIVNEIVESIAFDYFGNNLYKSNTLQKKIEVHSLTTGEKTEFSYTENPYDLIVVPEEGMMFVVFRTSNEYHIDKAQMNGLGSRSHIVEHGLMGPRVSLAYDQDLKRIFWADESTGRIESVDTEGQNRLLFRTGLSSPVSLAILDNEVFWTSRKSKRLTWADKKMAVPGNKGLNFQFKGDSEIMYLQTIFGPYTGEHHACRKNNGDCSHICLVTDTNKKLCACPSGYVVNADQKTCRQKTSCSADEIKCPGTDKCIKDIQKCNGVKDCPDGDDEKDCSGSTSSCQTDEFACHDGECIKKSNRCDSIFNCKDHSDEENCDNHTCTNEEYRCRDGSCISKYLVCNGNNDCDDFSDEEDCNGHACDDNSFKCGTGLCIPRNWECDGQVDCNDGSDEHDTCKPTECGEKMFSCQNGRCIDELLRCNTIDDCSDNSDELNCPESTKFEALICSKDQYRCRNSTICISESLKCDGRMDCPQHDDERGCGRCIDTEFSCSNKKCIPLEWVCDQTDDCGDDSDEQHCDSKQPYPEHLGRNCSEGEFACKSGFCITLERTCDGQQHCLDGSDEGGECDKACEKNTCENMCHKTPAGPLCSCHQGYKLAMDGKSCEDVDECQHNVCPQICTNRIGSFSCSCYDGYALRLNHISCKATGPAVKIITTTKDDIRMMSPWSPDNSLTILFRDPDVEITGLDVNTRTNAIYWSNENLGIINKMDIDTKKRTTATMGVGRPEILAVDWITDNVYYFNNKQAPMIKACDIERNKCSLIVHIEGSNDKVTAIAVEPIKEKLFWSQVKWKIYEKPTSVIISSDLIGADHKTIVHENLGVVSGLTIDLHRSLLYWADNFQTSIECVDFDGNNRRAILADLISRPIGMYFYEDSLYWKTESSGVLRKRQLFGDMIYTLIPIGSNNLNRLFVISQISRQPAAPNKCKDKGCDHMCVMRRGEPTCICGNGFPTNGTSCAEDSAELDIALEEDAPRYRNDAPMVTRAQQQQRTGSRSSALTGLAITLVTFALMYSVYFYLKKKRPGFFKRRDLSIYFQNPSFARRNNNNNSSMTSTSSILMPGQHEYSNPITEMSNPKMGKTENNPSRRIEIAAETSDNEHENDPSSNYHSRLIS